jgi:hypothetical protein
MLMKNNEFKFFCRKLRKASKENRKARWRRRIKKEPKPEDHGGEHTLM